MSRPCWDLNSVGFRYPLARTPALDGITTKLDAGRSIAILGPNGSGKSTLLRLLLGSLSPDNGTVCYDGRAIDSWGRRDFARRVAAVPQDEEIAFPMTVRELVEMGRYPHLGPLRSPGLQDRNAVDEALDRCDLGALRDRRFQTLSGGERQRARIARALAQQPEALVLDEPTRALDIRHEMGIFELLDGLVREGVTVVLVTHNLNLAARFADDLLLLSEGALVARGAAADVITEQRISEVYRWPVQIVAHPGPGPHAGSPQVTPLASANG